MGKFAIVLMVLILSCENLFAQPPGYSLRFNGRSSFVNCGDSASLRFTGNHITLEALVYVLQFRTNVWEGCIINKEQNVPDVGYMLRCGNNGQLNFNIGDSSWHELNSLTGELYANDWAHVAGTYDGSVQKIYINGNLINSSPLITSIGNSSPITLRIGASENYPGRVFNGIIDEVRIWNVARTEEQLVATAGDTIGPQYYRTADSGLVGYWRFDEGSGQIAHDLSIYHNDGTLGSTGDTISNYPRWTGVPVSVRMGNAIHPRTHHLAQNYPNPFNPSTRITYSIQHPAFVIVKVYDILGREIRTLVDEFQQANTYSVSFDARNISGGVYYYKLQAGDSFVDTKKMVLIR